MYMAQFSKSLDFPVNAEKHTCWKIVEDVMKLECIVEDVMKLECIKFISASLFKLNHYTVAKCISSVK
jgi:hypothetical protein